MCRKALFRERARRPVRRVVALAVESRAFELPLMPGVAAEVLASSLDDQSDAARLAQLSNIPNALRNTSAEGRQSAFREMSRYGKPSYCSVWQRSGKLRSPHRCRAHCSVRGLMNLWANVNGTATRLWAKEGSRACRKNVEIAYLCGLLHNVGVPVVLPC